MRAYGVRCNTQYYGTVGSLMLIADAYHCLETFFRRHRYAHQFMLLEGHLFYQPWCLFQELANISLEQGPASGSCCLPASWRAWERLTVEGVLSGGRTITISYLFRRYGPLLERCEFQLSQVTSAIVDIRGATPDSIHQRHFSSQHLCRQKHWSFVRSSPPG